MNTTPLPQCLGFIMDGNRRFATEQNLPTMEGHRRGFDVLLEVVGYIQEVKIPHAVFYAFSTENWNRSEAEVSYLMTLFSSLFTIASEKLISRGIRIRIIGEARRFFYRAATKDG